MRNEQENVDVKVRFTAKGVDLFREKSWVFPWGKVQVLKDGTGLLEVGIVASEIPFFAEYFFSLGTEAVVLQPEELREAVRTKLVRALEEYDIPNS